VQDRKKLRPGVVGGRPGLYAISSEMCGLDSVIPERDKSKDFQPMHLDMPLIRSDRQEVQIYRQTEPLPPDISIDDLSGTFQGPKAIDVAA
jgi:hypothetical protein